MKNKKKKKKVKLIYKIVVSILFLASIIFIVGLMLLNVLTMKWFMLVTSSLLFIDFLFWLFIIKSKKKTISSIIALPVIMLLLLGSFYIFKTNGFLTGMTTNYKTYNYSIVVLKESNYQEIEDLDGLSMGYLSNDSEEVDKSLEYINEKILPEYIKYKDTKKLIEGLINENTKSILIEDSYFNMMKEENTKFANNSRVIKTFKIRIKIDDFSKDVNVTKKPFHIFISGIDTYGTVESVSRSDVNMVVSVNPKTKQILMTSIPRDYYVSLHNVDGYKDKLTHAGLYGVDMSVKTIEDLLDIEINYYVKVNFTSVIDIVEALDGVEVYSDYNFTSIDGYNYKKGYNKVNGEEALSFARERKAFATGDNQRIKNGQALLQAVLKKCISKDILYKYNKLLNSLNGSFITNMPTDRITSLIRMQLKDMVDWTITSNSLTGTNSSNYTYSYASQKLYVMSPKPESIEEAHDLIMAVVKGDILENSYGEKTGTSHTVTKSSNSTNNTVIDSKKDKEDLNEIEEAKNTSSTIEDNEVEVPSIDTNEQVNENDTTINNDIVTEDSNDETEELPKDDVISTEDNTKVDQEDNIKEKDQELNESKEDKLPN